MGEHDESISSDDAMTRRRSIAELGQQPGRTLPSVQYSVSATGTGGQRRLLLRPEEAAALLGIGRTTVYGLLRTGELHSVQIGTSRRIAADELVSYVERLTSGGSTREPTCSQRVPCVRARVVPPLIRTTGPTKAVRR